MDKGKGAVGEKRHRRQASLRPGEFKPPSVAERAAEREALAQLQNLSVVVAAGQQVEGSAAKPKKRVTFACN